MKLTVDKNGNDATSAGFDPDNIVQWGFDSQYMDNYNAPGRDRVLRRRLAARRRWQDRRHPRLHRPGRQVVQRRRLEGPLHPDGQPGRERPARRGQRVRVGQPGDRRGPHLVHLLRHARRPGKKPFTFGFAVQPTVNGKITSPLHADTFSILKTTKVPGRGLQGPDGDGRLRRTADGLRRDAGRSDQAAGLVRLDRRAASPASNLDWDVAKAMLAYPDIPNHQSYVPDYAEGAQRHAGLRQQLPDDCRARHGCRAREAPADPPGHLRRRDPVASRSNSAAHGPLEPPARGGRPSNLGEASVERDGQDIDRSPRADVPHARRPPAR